MNPQTEDFKTKRAAETWVVDQATGLSDLETRLNHLDVEGSHTGFGAQRWSPEQRTHPRTRSFLYASLAATVARMYDLDRIRFYENGITSINLPICEQVVGARASRTTHPQTVQGLAQLFSLLVEGAFQVENPFIWKTKTDAVNLIGDAGCAALIKHARSCMHTISSTKSQPHCGRCSQCIGRRFGTLASRYAEFDPTETYKVDLLTGERPTGEDRTLVESYAKTALEIDKMSDVEFFDRFPEATRVLQYLDGTANETGSKLLDLHQRHAHQVVGVINRAIADHATDLWQKKLPDSCLIVLALPEEYKSAPPAEVPAHQSTFKKNGDKWTVTFDGKTVYMNSRVGMRYIAQLLRHPNQVFSAAELCGLVSPAGRAGLHSGQQLAAEGIQRVSHTKLDAVLDEKTIKECQDRENELKEAIDSERSRGNTARVGELSHELRQLRSTYRRSLNVRGLSRNFPDSSERARSSVTKAISRSISEIRKEHESLARHLSNSIHCGSKLTYHPESEIPWNL